MSRSIVSHEKCKELQRLIRAVYPLVDELATRSSSGVTARITSGEIQLNDKEVWGPYDEGEVIRVLKTKIPVFECNATQVLYLTVMEIPEVSALYMSGYEPLVRRWRDARSAIQSSQLLLGKLVFSGVVSEGDSKQEPETGATLREASVVVNLPCPNFSAGKRPRAIIYCGSGGRYKVETDYLLLAIVNLNKIREAVGMIVDFEHRLKEV